MNIVLRRGLCMAALLSLSSVSVQAETIVKLNLGSIGPDIELIDGVLSTVDDGVANTPGDQDSDVTFHGFVAGSVTDITPLTTLSAKEAGRVNTDAEISHSGNTLYYTQSLYIRFILYPPP